MRLPPVLLALAAALGLVALSRKSPAAASPAPTSGAGGDLPDVPGLRAALAREPGLGRAFLAMADRLGWTEAHRDYGAAIVSFESEWKPDAVNPYSGASGLIQWMPSTAKAFGTTVEAIRQMSALEQIPLVEDYFERRKGLAPRDLYLLVFYPAAIGKSDEHVVFRRGEKGYEQNAGLDAEKDGTITVGNIRAVIDGRVVGSKAKPRVEV